MTKLWQIYEKLWQIVANLWHDYGNLWQIYDKFKANLYEIMANCGKFMKKV